MFADTLTQLRKLSIRKMNFLVTQIEFDFDDEDQDLTEEDKIEIIENSLGAWEADDENDLIEEITCATGWCIKSIDYRNILR